MSEPEEEPQPLSLGQRPASAEEQPFALVPKAKEERPLLLAEGVTKLYPIRTGLFGRARFVHAVEEVSFFLRKAETLAVVGESGSGCLLYTSDAADD